MKFFYIILITIISIYLNAKNNNDIYIYTCKWISPEQLKKIIIPLIGPEGSIYVLENINKIIISDVKKNIDILKKRIKIIDVKDSLELITDSILSSFVIIDGTLEVNNEKIFNFKEKIKCGETFTKEKYEKILYRIGRTPEKDRYFTSGEEISITPTLEPGELYLEIEFKYKKLIGWDKHGNPILHKKRIFKKFIVETNKKIRYYLIKNKNYNALLKLFVILEDFNE